MKLNLQSLQERRKDLTLKFAQDCLKNTRFKRLFPENTQNIETRSREKYKVPFYNTERMKQSAITQMTPSTMNRKPPVPV